MWAVIVGIIICIIGIVLIILGLKESEDTAAAAGVGIICLAILLIMISLGFGYTFNKEDKLREKKQLEYLLENKIDLYVIEKAETHNRNVTYGNNLWCRFTIDDREEYIIDINKYLTNEESENE